MELQLQGDGSTSAMNVSDIVFGSEFNKPLVHQVVTSYLAGARRGTKAQKSRSTARGGGGKPWRQKGTGRARSGTSRSPLWRGGGVAFAAVPRDYSKKVNKKMYRAGLRSILAELVRQDRLMVIESFQLETPKTKDLACRLKGMGLDDVLILAEEVDDKLYLASRNLPRIGVSDITAVDPVSLIRHEKVLITVGAVRQIEEWLG